MKRRPGRVLFAALALPLLLLTSCSTASSPRADLQTKANDLVTAANGGDATGVRTAADLLLREIQAQGTTGALTPARVRRLHDLTSRILAEAALLEPRSSPAPSTTPPSPTPSPTPPPTPPSAPTPTPAAPSVPPAQPSSQPSPVIAPTVAVSGSPASGGTG